MPHPFHILYTKSLQLLDKVQQLRELSLNNVGAYVLGDLYSAGLLAIAFGLLAYWLYCASHLVMLPEVELTEADIAPMRWKRRCWVQFQSLFLSSGWTVC